MEPFKVSQKPFGVIIKIQTSIGALDIQNLDAWFSKPESIKTPIYIDLSVLGNIDEYFLEYLLSQIKRLSLLGVPTTLVRNNPDIRKMIRESGFERPIMILDFLDEATFPLEANIKSKLKLDIEEKVISTNCPKCSNPLREGAYRCLKCGQVIAARRHDRHPVAIPFLYGKAVGNEFLNSNWLGGVSEDLDMDSFSGMGFFSPRDIPRGSEIHFIFPTLRWKKKKKIDRSSLTIFTGRVKNSTPVDTWVRIGIALFNMFEYEGSFDVKTEVQGDARLV